MVTSETRRPSRAITRTLTAAVVGTSVALLPAAATAGPGGVGAGAPAKAAKGKAAGGTTYYVDADGGSDDAAGTSSGAAWRSLDRVAEQDLAPGDAVLFARGRTWTGELVLSRSGTADAPITVGAYGSGDRPVVTGGANCVTVTGAHWLITDLRATACDWAGFELRGHHTTLRRVRADNSVAGVSITDDAHHNTVRDSALVDNNRMSVNTPGGDDDSGAFGVLLNGDDNVIAHNTITGSYAESHDYGVDGAAVEVYNGDRNRVEYNITRDNETFTELGHQDGETADDNVFAYNVVTSTHDTGAFLVTRGADDGLGPVRGTVAVNNSVSIPAEGGEGWTCYGGCDATILKLRNNVIAVGGKTGYEDGDGADEDTSVYDGGRRQFEPGPDSVTGDPRFTGAKDLRVRAGSPAIGRGEPVGYAVDITGAPVPASGATAGAYEYQG
ncbi:right-handed parallel beta-helix repeat-containing protein [Yinghuangia sp. ASG 101]|uniref:right-handed parallel beta-helix repeat-containing protein n=1 Tax=Yinghuangia sp. ASG 101 TaxID=2896848 RepID=UPI001E2AA052|nr:right-handed parallel beta-helix repeat-containing protein [Yinghuangia sp. ASG 101]UGQ13386.1 right-handed parallel beta-helix repeat-containing protein [Yinghuangia sp. ASG 101]